MTLGVAILRTRWQPIGGAKIELRRDWPTSPRDLLVIVPDLENWPVAEFPMPYAKGFPSLTRQFSSPPPLPFFSFLSREGLGLPSSILLPPLFYFLLILFSRIIVREERICVRGETRPPLTSLIGRKWFRSTMIGLARANFYFALFFLSNQLFESVVFISNSIFRSNSILCLLTFHLR